MPSSSSSSDRFLYVVSPSSTGEIGPLSPEQIRERVEADTLRRTDAVRSGLGTSYGTVSDVLTRFRPRAGRVANRRVVRQSPAPVILVVVLFIAAGIIACWPSRYRQAAANRDAAEESTGMAELPSLDAPPQVRLPGSLTAPPVPASAPVQRAAAAVSPATPPVAPVVVPPVPVPPAPGSVLVLAEFTPASLHDPLWALTLRNNGEARRGEDAGVPMVRVHVDQGDAYFQRSVTVPAHGQLRMSYRVRLGPQTMGQYPWSCARLVFQWDGDEHFVFEGRQNFRTQRGWESGTVDIPRKPSGTTGRLMIGPYACTSTLDIAWLRLEVLP